MLAARRAAFGALLTVAAFLAAFGAAFHTPLPPATGPDPSWMVALGEAVRNHMVFGRQIVYTWGPLGYLEVPGAVPATYAAKTLFALSIACASGLLVILRARSEGLLWQRVAFVLGALIVLPYANALYVVGEADVHVSLLLVLCFTFPALAREKPLRMLALSLGLLGGFVSLVKFSLYLSVLVVGFGLFVVRALEHRHSSKLCRADIESASLYLVGFAIASAGIYYWVTYGFCYQFALGVLGAASALLWILRLEGKLSGIRIPASVFVVAAVFCSAVIAASAPYRDFLYYSLQVAGGYSAAVAREVNSSEVASGLLLLVLAALLAIREAPALGPPRVFAVLAILVLAYKQAVVRSDATHLIPYFLAVSLVGCVLLLCATQRRSGIYAVFLVALSLPALPAFANYGPNRVRVVTFPAAVADGLAGAFRAIAGWQRNFDTLAAQYKRGVMPDMFAPSIRQKLGNEPVDLVGTEVNIVFANGLPWRPRPAFHAPYSVFTPSLDVLNRDSIRSGDTGRELLAYESVDNKYPFGDEPLTSRQLICSYAPDETFPSHVATQGGTELAILRRSPGRCGTALRSQLGTIGWNEPLPVRTPPGRLAFLFIDFRYSPLGKALRSLFRIAPVWIDARYRSGLTAKYRVVPELLGGGLLVNPIPRNIKDVETLLTGLNADPVDAVEFTTSNGSLFSARMSYRLEEVPYARPMSSPTSSRSS